MLTLDPMRMSFAARERYLGRRPADALGSLAGPGYATAADLETPVVLEVTIATEEQAGALDAFVACSRADAPLPSAGSAHRREPAPAARTLEARLTAERARRC